MNFFIKNNILEIFKFIILFFSILIPLLGYLIGYTYYNGRMLAYGLSADYFPIDIQKTYYQAYIGIGYFMLQTINKKYIWLILGFFSFIVSSYIWFYIKIIPKIIEFDKNNEKLNSFRKKLHVSPFLNKLGNFFLYQFITFCICVASIIGIVVYWQPLIKFEETGYQVSKIEAQDFVKNGCSIANKNSINNCTLVTDKDKKIIAEGLVIAKNNDNIAILTNNEVIYFKLQDIYIASIKHSYKSN